MRRAALQATPEVPPAPAAVRQDHEQEIPVAVERQPGHGARTPLLRDDQLRAQNNKPPVRAERGTG